MFPSDDNSTKITIMTRQFWLAVRQALLMIVHAIEVELDFSPKTSELRKHMKTLPKR